MTYQQWDHHQHYQGIPEYRPLIQPWQHELGCPTPRPRSYSLGSRPPSSADLTEVSTKRTYNPSPLILPLDCNRNYISTFPSSKSSKSFGFTKNRLFWLILSLVLSVSILSGFAWWKYRTRPSITVEAFDLPSQPIVQHPPPVSQYPPQQQHQHQQQIPQQPYHPLPPPPPALQSPSQQQQQQYAQQAAYWQQQQQQQQQLYHHYQQPQYLPEGYAYQQQPQQQHYSYAPQQQQQQYMPPPAQDQHRQHQAQPVQQQQPPPQHHPNVLQHHGEPNAQKPWILQHMNTPAPVQSAPEPVQEHRHHEHQAKQQQQEQQQPPVQHKEPEPELSRQEERAKARNEARSSNPKTSSKKILDDDIWEREPVVPVKESDVPVGDLKTLRFEPAQFSFNQSVEGSDGIIYLTSYEDSEDVTVEVIEEA